MEQFKYENPKEIDTHEIKFDATELADILNGSTPVEQRREVRQFYRKLEYETPIIPERDSDTPEEDFQEEEEEKVLRYISEQKEKFHVNERDLKLVIAAKILDAIKYANITDIYWFSEKFTINLEAIPSTILSQYVSRGVATALERIDLDSYEKLKDIFPSEKEALVEGVKMGYAESLEKGWYQVVRLIYKTLGKEYNLSFPSKEEFRTGLMTTLQYGLSWGEVGTLIEKAEMSEDEVIEVIRQRIQNEIKNNFIFDFKIDEFCEIAHISEANIQKLLSEPVLKSVNSSLRTMKEFSALPLRIQLRLCLIKLENPDIDKEIPYISKAYEMNQVMATNLIQGIKIADSESRENIHTLIDGIPNNYAELSDDQYRYVVQEKLLSYKRNNDIVEALKEKNIRTETWLNYDQKESVILENPEDNLAEFLYPQTQRLLNSAQYIKGAVLEKLNPHQLQFKNRTIENKERDIVEKKLFGINEKIKNSKKDSDIYEKLIEVKNNTQVWLDNIKPIPMWHKIIGDIDAIEKPLKDLNTFIEEIFKNQKSKIKNSELKNYIEKNVLKIEDRMAMWIELVEASLKTVLGDKDGEILKNSIDVLIREEKNHWQVDFNDIKATVKGYGMKSNSLVGRSTTISLWNRDMRDDIYLGHYTNCCIRSDSAVLEGELTITDYLTDLGMQVVVMKDDKTKKPFAAAWCFIGEDENNEVKLVIDNIEANTGYSAPFKKQLEEKLKDYIERYANAIGLNAIEQGPHNNDLVIAKYGEHTKKVGGYNRAKGYYLEGERDDE